MCSHYPCIGCSLTLLVFTHNALLHILCFAENVVLVRLLEGTKHKNDQVQTCCHENIAVLLKKQPSLKAELLAPIEKAIETGLADNSSPCRAAARSVLVAYHKLEPEKSNRYAIRAHCSFFVGLSCSAVEDGCSVL